jgi:hypothetical protein
LKLFERKTKKPTRRSAFLFRQKRISAMLLEPMLQELQLLEPTQQVLQEP